MQEFVEINSTITITVTPGLQYNDFTNPDAHVADRLRIAPTWPQATIQIRAGIGTYPAEIIEWGTVKALAKDKIITIGQKTTNVDDETLNKAQDLDNALEAIGAKKTRKTKSLAEITQE